MCNIFLFYTSTFMSATKKLKEKALLYKVKAKKDPQAFGELYDYYIERIYRFVFFKVSNKEEAEDLTSEIFLKAWNYLTDGRKVDVRSFSGLIYTIARSRIIDFYRKKSKEQVCSIDHIPELELMIEDKQFKAVATTYDLQEVLVAVKKMKQTYQEVILLRYLDELSIKEIAEITQKSSGSVRVLLHRALKVLQSLMGNSKEKA